MDIPQITDTYVDYFRRNMPALFGHKPKARQDAMIQQVEEYAKTRLPEILIDRRDPIVLCAYGESDQ